MTELETFEHTGKAQKVKRFPVAEIFGPTVQGEGIDQGVPCHFVRFGGCDFRCSWCDTPHAVLPAEVKTNDRLSAAQILERVTALPEGPTWVVLSGGNPVLHDLTEVVQLLKHAGYKVSVETQGSRFKDWLRNVNRLCVSPKPPSSGMKFDKRFFFMDFLVPLLRNQNSWDNDWWSGRLFVKVVVFDRDDYEFAKNLYLAINENSAGIGLPFFLSAGNDAGRTVGNPTRRDDRTTDEVRRDLAEQTLQVVEWVMHDRLMSEVRVQSQFHVILWGNELGR